jgi:hypothetical protein
MAVRSATIRGSVTRFSTSRDRAFGIPRVGRGSFRGGFGPLHGIEIADVTPEQMAEAVTRDFLPYRPVVGGNPADNLRLRSRLRDGGAYDPQISGSWSPRDYEPDQVVNCHTPQLYGFGDDIDPNSQVTDAVTVDPRYDPDTLPATTYTPPYPGAPVPSSAPPTSPVSSAPFGQDVLNAVGSVVSSFLNKATQSLVPKSQLPRPAPVKPSSTSYVALGVVAVAGLAGLLLLRK